MKFTNDQHLKPNAFTLVEATMAVGIAAVGILTLVALIPAGLGSLRESAADVAEAKIVQTIQADYQMADWRVTGSTVIQPDDQEFYFGQDGIEVTQGSFEHLYTARASVEGESLTLAGDTSANQFLRRLVIRISREPDEPDSFNDERRHRTHETTMAFFDQTGVQPVLQ